MWSICKGILTLLDGFFNIINTIWRIDFFNNDYVNKIFSGAIIVAGTWLILKATIELVMNFIIKNDRDRASPFSIYKGICISIVAIFLITPLFNFGYELSTSLTDSIISVSKLDAKTQTEQSIAKNIIKALIYKDETKDEHIDQLVDNWKTIDINDTEGGIAGFGDSYKYSINFFMLIVLSCITIFLLFFVAIQMGRRVTEIALYKIIGIFCCTSLTNSGKAFEVWIKSVLGLFLITSVQFICLGLLFEIFSNAFNENLLVGIFIVIGSLLFIISTPTLINTLLNQSSGLDSSFRELTSLIAIGNFGKQGLSLATTAVGKVGSAGVNLVNHNIRSAKNGVTNMMNKSRFNLNKIDNWNQAMQNQNFMKAREISGNIIQSKFNKKTNTFSNLNSNMNSVRLNALRCQYVNQNRRK